MSGLCLDLLPRNLPMPKQYVLAKLPILLPDTAYQEHDKNWQPAGQHRYFYPARCNNEASTFIDACLQQNSCRYLLVINSNNPTGLQFSVAQLLQWSQCLQGGGCLIVDEAFIDSLPTQSLLTEILLENVIVLRSFGKFFGLPGLRLEFVMGSEALLKTLGQKSVLWSINAPACHIAMKALADTAWQQQARSIL